MPLSGTPSNARPRNSVRISECTPPLISLRSNPFRVGRTVADDHQPHHDVAVIPEEPPSIRSGDGVHDLVAEQVGRRPGAPAVRDALTGEALSYTELWRSAGRLAADLTAGGVGAGHVVAVRLGRSVNMIVAMLGNMRSGATDFFLHPGSPPNPTAALLADTRAAAIIETPDDRRSSTEHGLR